jgi:hypothetical protein
MCIPEMALSSSSNHQGDKKILLDVYLVLNGPLKENNQIKELLNPFDLSFQNEEPFKRNSKGILFVPTEKAEIIRLDCPTDKSTYPIRDWRSFWWTISEWTGDVSRSRIKEDWEKAVNDIKSKGINDLCSGNTSKEADYGLLKRILAGKQAFYLVTEEGGAKEGWGRGGQQPKVMPTPKDMWADLCKMCKDKRLDKVAIVVAYDQSASSETQPPPQPITSDTDPGKDETTTEDSHPGESRANPSKIRELWEKGELAELKQELDKSEAGAAPEVAKLRKEMDTKLEMVIKFQYQRPHAKPSEKIALPANKLANLNLTPKDNYRMFIETLSPSYLYVFQIDAEGRVDRLFPNPFYNKTDNPVLPLLSLQIPFSHTEWLYLEEVGREAPPKKNTLYFLASPWPAKKLDELYGKLHKETNREVRNEILNEFMAALHDWKTMGLPALYCQEFSFFQVAKVPPAARLPRK